MIRFGDELSPQCITFRVTGDLVEVIIGLYRKRLVTPLVYMPRANLLAVLLPIANVHHGQFLHKPREIPILFGPQQLSQ